MKKHVKCLNLEMKMQLELKPLTQYMVLYNPENEEELLDIYDN